MQTTSVPVTVLPKRSFQALDDNDTSPMYDRLELMWLATSQREKVDKNLMPANKNSKLLHDRLSDSSR